MSGIELAMGAISAIGTGLSAIGQINAASAQEAQYRAIAQQNAVTARYQQQQAQEQRAIGQREAAAKHKEAEIVMSRQQALAAASGGSATDPTVLDLMGDTGAQGDINAQTALYEGESKGRGLDFQAALSRNSAAMYRSAASSAMTAGWIGAGSTVLSGFSDWMKYRPGALPMLGGSVSSGTYY